MKHLFVIFLLVIAIQANSQEIAKKIENSPKKEVVINHAMIEKYQNYKYLVEDMSISDVFSNYSFEEAKLILNGYRAEKLESLSEGNILTYLSEVRKQISNSPIIEKDYTEKNLAEK